MQQILAGDVRRAGDGRNHLASAAIVPSIARLKGAADQTLLDPGITLEELAVRGKTGELGTGSRAARRTVIGLARAQHEISAVSARQIRGSEQFHMIDQRVPLSIDGLADPARKNRSAIPRASDR